MKRKIIVTGPEARKKVIAGVNFAVDAVKLTLGPYGRNFASGIIGGPVRISNDGISLLKEIEGNDEIEDLGVRAVREAASRANDEAGDGTTSAAVMTQAILAEFNLDDEIIVRSRKSPIELINQVREEVKTVIKLLTCMSKEVSSREELISVARVSVEDPALAELIGGAQWDVGKDGTVISEEAISKEDSIEYINGIRLDNGYSSSRIINNQERQSLELSDVYVILTNKVFHGSNWVKQLKHVWDYLSEKGATNIILMGRGFDDEAIGTCVQNIKEGSLKIFPLNAPYVNQNEVMEDIASVLGGKYLNVDESDLSRFKVADVGHASKIFAKRFEGIIAGFPKGQDESIDNRVAERCTKLEEQLAGELSPFERRNIETRLSQLRSGTAVVKVGAETEQARKYRKDKVDDAVNAVKAAMQEGIVPGGGLALARIADDLKDEYLIKKPLKAVHAQIMAHAPKGFVIEDWVKDPVKVVRISLQKAAEIAASLATTEIAINFEREKPQYVTTVDNKIRDTSDE